MSQQINLRAEPEMVEALEARAQELGCTRNELLVRLVDFGLKNFGTERLNLSVSEIACLDQLAERKGVTRIELMKRWLSERLRREYVDERNAKLQDLGHRIKA